MVREGGVWSLFVGASEKPAARVALDQEDAWRLFTKGLSPEKARLRTRMEGDPVLGGKILETISIIG